MELFRLYTVHHRRDAFLDMDSKYFTPIQVGAEGASFDLGVARDDTVKPNLSAKNRHYNELTAVYWMAQQKLPDYVGLMHYRRIFTAPDSLTTLRANVKYALAWAGCKIGVRKYLDETLTRKKISDRTQIEKECLGLIRFLNQHLREADIVLPMRGRLINVNARSLYARSHFVNDFDLFFSILRDKYPEMSNYITNMEIYRHNYLYNMFIFRKEIFLEYAKKLFDVLFELEKNIDLSEYDSHQGRVFGFLAERFMVVFVEDVMNRCSARLLELPVAKCIEPAGNGTTP